MGHGLKRGRALDDSEPGDPPAESSSSPIGTESADDLELLEDVGQLGRVDEVLVLYVGAVAELGDDGEDSVRLVPLDQLGR